MCCTAVLRRLFFSAVLLNFAIRRRPWWCKTSFFLCCRRYLLVNGGALPLLRSIMLVRFYTDGDGPDPNMTPYYQSVPMAMWVTLLNLCGEAPLCDYTTYGKVRSINFHGRHFFYNCEYPSRVLFVSLGMSNIRQLMRNVRHLMSKIRQ